MQVSQAFPVQKEKVQRIARRLQKIPESRADRSEAPDQLYFTLILHIPTIYLWVFF